MTQDLKPSVAIIGGGPSGCYMAQFLRRHFKDAQITIFDSLPVPYGLVRFGVAPDHLGTKAVAQQFDRLFEREGVKFVGNTEIGTKLSLQELQEKFEIVVLALGLSADRKMGIPGENLAGVYGSGMITRLINSHPHESVENVAVGSEIVVIGHGNVAIDLVRLSLMSSEDLVNLGIPRNVADEIGSGAAIRIHVVGRSEISNAKFDTTMVRELAKFEDVKFISDSTIKKDQDPEIQKRITAIESLEKASNPEAKREVIFHFGWEPFDINGTASVQSAKFKSTRGQLLQLSADTIYSAIGFEEDCDAPIKLREILSDQSDLSRGFVSDGLYCVGWLRRGPQGTIPTNRLDAKMVSEQIVADFTQKNRQKVLGQL